MEPDEESNYTPQEKATYSKIKEYVKEKYGVNVHTSYIAQVKRMCGLDMGENYNKSKKENPEVKQCPQEKVEYIKDALRYFKLIQDVNQDMNYKDYIKDEYCDIYVRERDNLADRIIEAKYNLLFLTMAYKRSEIFNSTHYVTKRFEIGVILRRIYITVAWELALQIKAFTEDNDKDTLTVNKLKNHIFKYLKDDKKQEVFDEIGSITKTDDWNTASEMVSRISDYRNQIVGHNIFNSPKLTFDIEEA